MEPSHLNSSANEDRLESLLRQPAPVLADDGFSARVLAALPTPNPPHRTWQRAVCYLAGAAAGLAYVFAHDIDWGNTAPSGDQLAVFATKIGNSLSDPMVVVGLTIATLSLAVAFQAELRERFLP